jgi:intracellular multiplication protein IcmJ
MFPLSLGVRRLPDAKVGLPASPAKRKAEFGKALARDKYTCQCCGFRSEQYQNVAPLGGRLAVVCPFCDACLALDKAGQTGAGALVWLPEISQVDLNHLMRAIYVAKAEKGSSLAAAATRALDALTARRAEVKRRIGSDDPLLLATVFFESLNEAEYKARDAKLEGVRFMPFDKHIVTTRTGDQDLFPRILEYWRSPEGPFAQIPVSEWEKKFAGLAAVEA